MLILMLDMQILALENAVLNMQVENVCCSMECQIMLCENRLNRKQETPILISMEYHTLLKIPKFELNKKQLHYRDMDTNVHFDVRNLKKK